MSPARPKPARGSDSNAHHARVAALRYRIIRHDGTLLGSASDLAAAARLRGVLCQGQRKDFATVERGQRVQS